MKKVLAAAVVVASLLMVAVPAHAADQVIDATLGSTLSMTTNPTAAISWALASTGANTQAAGQVAINANQAYTVSVSTDKTRFTEYVTATSSYVASSPKTLAAALTTSATRSAGTAVVPGVGAAAISGTSTLLATGTGLGTDTYDVSLSQPTLITDSALPSGRTYHIVMTYTAASTL